MKKPTYLENLKARTQPQWKCKIHNKVTSVRFHDHRCQDCHKAEQRRQEVVTYLKEKGEL